MVPLRRFFIQTIMSEKNGSCTLTGKEAKHITKVLRMGPGDRIALMDGQGNRFQAKILFSDPWKVHLALECPLPPPPASSTEITLIQALIKSRPMDLIIQKCSELGITRIIPVRSERTVVKLDKAGASAKGRHWREIARSAAKQADRASPASVDPLTNFSHCLERWKDVDALKVILWERKGANDLKSQLKKAGLQRRFVGIVGPEGGFAEGEIQLAKDKGFNSVSLGMRILRAETAAIALVSIVQYEWGDLSIRVS
jgi:16S rRNA (uracil1498-N3)-methyltransferase